MEKKNRNISKNVSSKAKNNKSIVENKKNEENLKAEVKNVIENDIAIDKEIEKKAIKENKAAEKRIQRVLDKREAKAKRKEERAKRKAIKEELKAKRIARKKNNKNKENNKLKNEIKISNLTKDETKPLEENHSEKKIVKSIKKQSHNDNKKSGIGGWLAAVISLGVITLILTTVLTVGAIDMSDTNTGIGTGYRSALYELTEIMDNVDNDLNKVRVASTNYQQRRLYTDILVQSRLAENSLEHFPIDGERDKNLTIFFNTTGEYSREILNKLGRGEQLTKTDIDQSEYLYKINHAVQNELHLMIKDLNKKDIIDLVKGKSCNRIDEGFQRIENLTLEENREDVTPYINNEKNEIRKGIISSEVAEEKCMKYFKTYNIVSCEYAGETLSILPRYNFFLKDNKDRELFVEISQIDGSLAGFDFYEDCQAINYNEEQCKKIAEEYLNSLGLEKMIPVWITENKAVVEYKFVYEDEDRAIYPDMVKVKVCKTKGRVIGYDGTLYLKNHKKRMIKNEELDFSEARELLNKKLKVESSRLAVIPVDKTEILVYEFVCSYDDNIYLVYIDSNNGDEVRIYNIQDSEQGKFLK